MKEARERHNIVISIRGGNACWWGTEPTCQPLRHGQGVHRRAASGVNVVLLRHLLVEVEQRGVDGAQGVSRPCPRCRTAGRPAQIQGVHSEAEIWIDGYSEMHHARPRNVAFWTPKSSIGVEIGVYINWTIRLEYECWTWRYQNTNLLYFPKVDTNLEKRLGCMLSFFVCLFFIFVLHLLSLAVEADN